VLGGVRATMPPPEGGGIVASTTQSDDGVDTLDGMVLPTG